MPKMENRTMRALDKGEAVALQGIDASGWSRKIASSQASWIRVFD